MCTDDLDIALNYGVSSVTLYQWKGTYKDLFIRAVCNIISFMKFGFFSDFAFQNSDCWWSGEVSSQDIYSNCSNIFAQVYHEMCKLSHGIRSVSVFIFPVLWMFFNGVLYSGYHNEIWQDASILMPLIWLWLVSFPVYLKRVWSPFYSVLCM